MQEILEKLKGLIKNSQRIKKLIDNYTKLKEDSALNAYLMEKRILEISKIVNSLPNFEIKESLSAWVSQEKGAIEKAKEDFRFMVGEQIKELFQKENIRIKGQFPILRIGLYTLKVNFEFGEAVLYFGPEIERIKSKIPLEPSTIYQTIKKYDETLKKTKFEPSEFHQDLLTAYRKKLSLLNKPYGEKLLITEVLTEYVIAKQPPQFFTDPKRENYKEFPRTKLSYLLYLYKKSDLLGKKPRFYVATFDATTDKRRALWIPDNEEGEGTYYSYIAFEKEHWDESDKSSPG